MLLCLADIVELDVDVDEGNVGRREIRVVLERSVQVRRAFFVLALLGKDLRDQKIMKMIEKW